MNKRDLLFLPESRFILIWNSIAALFTIYLAVEIPLSLMFAYENSLCLTIIDAILTVFFSADIFVRWHSAYYEHGKLIDDKAKIKKDYLKGGFAIDTLATFPFKLMFLFFDATSLGNMSGSLRLFRLFRLLRIFRLFTLFRRRSKLLEKPIFVNIFQYTIFSFLASHGIACGWLLVNKINPDVDVLSNYIHSMYWAITTLTTVGYGDVTPHDNIGKVYTMMVMIIGVGMYGFIIGNISSLLVKVDAYRENKEKKCLNWSLS